METKILTIQLNDKQLPVLPMESGAHLTFIIHADGDELELTGNKAGLLLLAKAALGMAETLRSLIWKGKEKSENRLYERSHRYEL